jgi:NAD(P)-dependent dehydrogenase (short-subunit alcohol dehydrogenase family)
MKMKTVFFTEANRGIGFYTAKGLAKMGAKIVMACRDLSKSIPVCETIRIETGHSDAKSSGSLARGRLLGNKHPVI